MIPNVWVAIHLTCVEYDIVLCRLLSNDLLVIQISKHDLGTRRLDLFAMFLSPYEACDAVSFGNQQVQDIPADETWADNEDVLSGGRHSL